MKQLQVLPYTYNSNYSISQHSFAQSYGYKYYYAIPIIQFSHTVKDRFDSMSFMAYQPLEVN